MIAIKPMVELRANLSEVVCHCLQVEFNQAPAMSAAHIGRLTQSIVKALLENNAAREQRLSNAREQFEKIAYKVVEGEK